jgi:hypothetical protein
LTPHVHTKNFAVPDYELPKLHTHLRHEQPEVHLALARLALELKVVVLPPQLADCDLALACIAAVAWLAIACC